MIKVVVVGSGNVAEALSIALSACDQQVVAFEGIAGRNSERLTQIAQIAGCKSYTLADMPSADLYIVSVSDDAVESLAKTLTRPVGSIVVHTAGSVPMGSLDGVLYPMQTFTKGRRVNFREVPLFIEGESPIIREVAEALSDNVVEMESERRRTLHLAAVFACNFTNSMLSATNEILSQSDIPYTLFRPLVEETISKAFDPSTSPQEAQTGAARRGDQKIQQRHIEQLEGRDDLKEIYKLISKYIWETSKKI